MIPVPLLKTVAANLISGLSDSSTLLFGSTGMSEDEAATVKSAPNLTKAMLPLALVTTTDSPPPLRAAAAELVLEARETVADGRNG